jgi:hypothetical protein
MIKLHQIAISTALLCMIHSAVVHSTVPFGIECDQFRGCYCREDWECQPDELAAIAEYNKDFAEVLKKNAELFHADLPLTKELKTFYHNLLAHGGRHQTSDKDWLPPKLEKKMKKELSEVKWGEYGSLGHKNMDWQSGHHKKVFTLKDFKGYIFKSGVQDGADYVTKLDKFRSYVAEHHLNYFVVPRAKEIGGFIVEQKFDLLPDNLNQEAWQMSSEAFDTLHELKPVLLEIIRQHVYVMAKIGYSDAHKQNSPFLRDGSGIGIVDIDSIYEKPGYLSSVIWEDYPDLFLPSLNYFREYSGQVFKSTPKDFHFNGRQYHDLVDYKTSKTHLQQYNLNVRKWEISKGYTTPDAKLTFHVDALPFGVTNEQIEKLIGAVNRQLEERRYLSDKISIGEYRDLQIDGYNLGITEEQHLNLIKALFYNNVIFRFEYPYNLQF